MAAISLNFYQQLSPISQRLSTVFALYLLQHVRVQYVYVVVQSRTFFCLSLLPLKHLLLWRQRLLQELHVKLILLLHLLLLPEAHLIAHVALEAEAQRDHRVADAAKTESVSVNE